jgi:drug/metabolite transporter (DMT)-like permease
MKSNDQIAGHLAVAGAYAIFGLNIVFCKDIANEQVVSPMLLFTFRVAGAAALFWLLSLFMPREKVARRDILPLGLAALIGLFIPQLTFLKAITMASSIDTSVVGSLSPIFTMIFAFLFLKEPITWKKALGVALSFGGILWLILHSVRGAGAVTHTTPMGFALLLLNSISFALYLGAFRRLISRYSVVTFMKWAFLFLTVLSVPFCARELVATDLAAWPADIRWEIGYVIFFSTFVAYFLIPFGQQRIRPTLVSMYSYLQPIIAVVISIVAGLDILTWQKLLAILLVFTGVYLVIRSRAAA